MPYFIGETLRFWLFLGGVLVAARIGVTLTRLVKNWAIARGWYDQPNERSSHVRPVPRVGGLAIAGAFYLTLAIMVLVAEVLERAQPLLNLPTPGLLVGAGMMCLMGFFDDLRGFTPMSKLLGQVAAAILVVAEGAQLNFLFLPDFLWSWPGTDWLVAGITVIWIVGITNAVNILDGLDGLAAGVVSIILASLTAALAVNGQGPDIIFAAALIGALAGFMVYNYHPATIFMGDCGSLFIGFLIANIATRATASADTVWALLFPVLALGLPLLDTSTAFIRRILAGRSPFSADKDHIHHRIMRFAQAEGTHYRKAVHRLYKVSILFGLIAFALAWGKFSTLALALASTAILVVYVIVRLEYLRAQRKEAEPPPSSN